MVIDEEDNNLTNEAKFDVLLKILDIEHDVLKIDENNNIINIDQNNPPIKDINNEYNDSNNSMEESENIIDNIYENKVKISDVNNGLKNSEDNIEIENLTNDYEDLNYLVIMMNMKRIKLLNYWML